MADIGSTVLLISLHSSSVRGAFVSGCAFQSSAENARQ